MLLQGVQKVCCCVVKLISFERYEQNTAKKATIEDYLVNFVITINTLRHGLRTPREEIAFTARPKIHSHSQIFRYGRSIFCLPHRPKFSDFFDLCLHWVSVVRDSYYDKVSFFHQCSKMQIISIKKFNIQKCFF